VSSGVHRQISSALAIRFALFGLLGPFARYSWSGMDSTYRLHGAGVDCFGVLLATRMNALWSSSCSGADCSGSARAHALVLGATVANRWSSGDRGLVLGILTASSATGQLIFLPLAATLINLWLAGGRAPGLLWVVSRLPVLRSAPPRPSAAVGSRAIRRDHGRQHPRPPLAAGLRRTAQGIGQGLGKFDLWYWPHFFVCGLSTSGLIQTHFISMCGDYGSPPFRRLCARHDRAFDFVGTIGSGCCPDRLTTELLFWYYGCVACRS